VNAAGESRSRPGENMIVTPRGRLIWRGRHVRCAVGRGGISAAKREGDGATPLAHMPLRRVLYRPDIFCRPPETRLPTQALRWADGWCDDPADPNYNRPVVRPYPGRHEVLWREDRLYDVIVVLGWNDAPVIRGNGSAIFMHVARPDYGPTEGCVALALGDLLDVLREADPSTKLVPTR
jgi:L,D-peptidoglycan transpeptidase YkuD (ErfK/YbiS/YcfS/YnhG family)